MAWKRIRRDKADDLFSLLVRERACWCCETCHRYFVPRWRGKLDCSHLFSRKHKTIRWDPRNAWAQCKDCHQTYHSEPGEFDLVIDRIWGKGHMDTLRVKKNGTLKVPAWYKKQIIANLQSELDRVLEERARGVTGRIEFESPY